MGQVSDQVDPTPFPGQSQADEVANRWQGLSHEMSSVLSPEVIATLFWPGSGTRDVRRQTRNSPDVEVHEISFPLLNAFGGCHPKTGPTWV